MSIDVDMSDVKVWTKPDVKVWTKPDVKASVHPMDVDTSTEDKAMQIRGPISLVEYRSLVFNKHVYVFGEEHAAKPRCITEGPAVNVEDFIASTIRSSSPHVVDVYLEVPFKKSVEITNDVYIDRIYRKLHASSHSNLRLHAVDVRATDKSVTSNIVFFNDIHHTILQLLENKDKEDAIDKADIIARSISVLFDDLKEDKRIDYRPFLKDEQLSKQLQAIDSGVLLTLMLYMDIHTADIDLTTSEMRDLKEMCQLIVSSQAADYTMKGFLPAIADIHTKIFLFSALFVDIYTIARVFRSFRKVPGQYSEDAQRVIIYLGDSHSRLCGEILQVLGFTVISQTYADIEDYPTQTPSLEGISARSCVDISAFELPFFSHIK